MSDPWVNAEISLILKGIEIKGNPVRKFMCIKKVIEDDITTYKILEQMSFLQMLVFNKGSKQNIGPIKKAIEDNSNELYRRLVTKLPKLNPEFIRAKYDK